MDVAGSATECTSANVGETSSSIRQWKLSAYTRVVEGADGGMLLHNSFMGAIARIPVVQTLALKAFINAPFSELDSTQGPLAQLCRAGFFVPVEIDERTLVNDIVVKEAASNFHLIILPHENCNFRCRYCYESFERGRMRPEIVDGLKKFVSAKAPSLNHLSVAWFGGEPLLARKVVYQLSRVFLQACADHQVRYTSGITTNGYLLNAEVVTELLACKVTAYQITLDGPEHLHNQARVLASGGGTYRRILDNLIAMKQRDDDFTIKIRVNFGPQHTTEFMEDFLAELKPLFSGDGRFDLHFHPVGRWGGANDENLNICDASSAGVARTEFMKRAYTNGFASHMGKQHLRPHGNVCYAGRDTSMVVGADGKIYKCTVAFDDPRNHVGTLTDQGELIINRKRWEQWTTLTGKNTTKCNTCSFSPACQSRGCPLVAIQQQEPPCPISHREYEETVRFVGGIEPQTVNDPG